MVATNGSVKEQRLQLQEEVRLSRLQMIRRQQQAVEKSVKLLESFSDYDWVQPYVELYDHVTDKDFLNVPFSNLNDRRYGSYYPVFRNEQQLGLLRAPSRILCGTNPYAIGLLNGLTSYVIGTGYTYRVVAKRDGADETEIDRGQDIIDEFCERVLWCELEAELFQRSREDGEAFVRHFFDDSTGLTDVRTVEPEQCRQRPGADSYEEWWFGIKTDIHDIQKPLAYNFAYLQGTPEDEDVPAEEVVHIKVNTKRSIKRGMPDFAFSTLDALQIADKLRRNLGMGAAIQAAIAGIRQHDQASASAVGAFQTGQAYTQQTDPITGNTNQVARWNPGTIFDVGKGMNWVDPPGASNASAHVEILNALLRGAGQRWNAPAWLATSDASDTNFASSLTAESPFVKTIERWQAFYAARFKRTMQIVLQNAGKAGDIAADAWRRLKIDVEPRSAEARNRLEEAQTDQIYVNLGCKSRQKVIDEQGLDVEQTQTEIEEYNERMGTPGQGLELPPEEEATAAGSGLTPTEGNRFRQ